MLAGFVDNVPTPQQDQKWRKAKDNLKRWVTRAYARAAKVLNAKRLKGTGRPLTFTAPTPWPQEVDGAELLDELVETIKRHVVMPAAAAHAVALWITHTYVFTAMMVTPRLELKSPEKRCGKTTLLLIIGELAARTLPTANISASAIYRTVEAAQPTLLIDEADSFLKDNEELRGVLNAGFMRGGQVIRVTGDNHEPRIYSCWAPVALATIRPLPDTIEDRSVTIPLTRRLKTETITRLRLDRLTQLQPLTSRLQRWATDNIAQLETADPEIPEALNDRAADCWRILCGIAERAGGEWPERARAAAASLSGNADIETLGTLLLGDLRELFEASGLDALFSHEIIAVLWKKEDRPWSEYGKTGKPISKVQLAKLLAFFKVRPSDVHRTVKGRMVHAKGYKREHLTNVFERYLADASS
jgi:putative DNA primase/helicase